MLEKITQEFPQDCKFYNQPITMYKDMFGLYYIVFASNDGTEITIERRRVATNAISAFFQKRKYFK